eukprot:7044590-Prorocentrum_lima.AAC.1
MDLTPSSSSSPLLLSPPYLLVPPRSLCLCTIAKAFSTSMNKRDQTSCLFSASPIQDLATWMGRARP